MYGAHITPPARGAPRVRSAIRGESSVLPGPATAAVAQTPRARRFDDAEALEAVADLRLLIVAGFDERQPEAADVLAEQVDRGQDPTRS
jgi:hypothetical protein